MRDQYKGHVIASLTHERDLLTQYTWTVNFKDLFILEPTNGNGLCNVTTTIL